MRRGLRLNDGHRAAEADGGDGAACDCGGCGDGATLGSGLVAGGGGLAGRGGEREFARACGAPDDGLGDGAQGGRLDVRARGGECACVGAPLVAFAERGELVIE